MRDIGSRIRSYRLSRYAVPSDPIRRRLHWAWLVAIAWCAWVGFLSDHSFFRLSRLRQEQQRTQLEAAHTRAEILAIEKDAKDPRSKLERAERELRSTGMARPGEIIYRMSGGDSTTR